MVEPYIADTLNYGALSELAENNAKEIEKLNEKVDDNLVIPDDETLVRESDGTTKAVGLINLDDGSGVKLYIGPKAKYDALPDKQRIVGFFTDDPNIAKFRNLISNMNNILSGAISVPEAKHAVNADEAKHALNADDAKRAEQATNADTADYARETNTAKYATEAGTANNANRATAASFAESAERANSAARADYATEADTAGTAKLANKATNADYATNANTANRANEATNADYADHAASATNADHAASATNADNATSATNASRAAEADAADYATKAYKDADGNIIPETYVKKNEIGNLSGFTDGLSYRLSSDGTYYICTGEGTAGDIYDLIMPATYKGLPVKEIDAYAFSNSLTLHRVILPNTLTKIGNDAFVGSRLMSVSLPSTLIEIGARAFSCPILTNVEFLGTSLTKIGTSAFASTKLREIDLPEGLTEIGETAFGACKLVRVNLPSTLVKIGKFAFCDNLELRYLYIPSSVQYVGATICFNCHEDLLFQLGSIPMVGSGAWSTTWNNRKGSVAYNYQQHVKVKSDTRYAVELGTNALEKVNIYSDGSFGMNIQKGKTYIMYLRFDEGISGFDKVAIDSIEMAQVMLTIPIDGKNAYCILSAFNSQEMGIVYRGENDTLLDSLMKNHLYLIFDGQGIPATAYVRMI